MLDLGNLFYLLLILFDYSGSTCVSLLTYGRKIYVANVGDSRAISIRLINDCNNSTNILLNGCLNLYNIIEV